MKFGHHLKTSLYSEWTFHYLAYDELKSELKKRTRDGQWNEQDEESFVELLEKDLDKVYTFQKDKSIEINRRIQNCEKEINDIKDSETTTEENFVTLEEELSLIIADVHDLAKFSRLNYTGFLKIIKKHDKQTKWVLKPQFMVRLNAKPFYKEDYDALIVKLSRLYDIVRTRGNPVKGNSAAGGQQQNFVRNTAKYWVHPDNITELKLLILKHLPVLVFNPNKEFEKADSAISSIYFDNEDFELYLGRLEKTEGAEAIRLRWYGGMDTREIFVERKTHREDWTGEKSVKERFPMKEKYVNKYLKGEYTLDKQLSKMKAKGKSEKEIENTKRLSEEVQYRVITKKLQPVVRSFYNRTAFQLPGDARVRISLDTELSLIREDNFEKNPRNRCGDNWRRTDIGIDYPFSQLPERDIEKFPYAILEVKLQTQYGQEPPQWAQELVENKIQLLPFWLPQMGVDIRKPSSSFRLQRPPSSGNLLEVLVDNPSSDTDENANEGTPLTLRHRSQPSNSDEDSDIDENADERTPLMSRSNADQSENQNASNSNFLREVPTTYRGKRIAFPVRVEPKVYFANERTFLSWLNFTVILGGLAVGLLNFGDRIAIIAAGMFTAVSMSAMLYSLIIYYWRARKIRKRDFGPYDDRIGPTFLCIALLIATMLNFRLKFREEQQ
ncbi:6617_t:CDS:2 [Diversispora eburnea]|uniref:Vacuolar transporter chaperone complex subunit 4 n=1 Tax=Diversispora eburnea TaxID=1213867 RepID=A0A9N9BW84_9GLOM|nr:6617_t:CDS:2 [Diversispora eburnea]